MFTFTDNTRLFRQLGLALFLCQLNVFIACMPPFQTGIWVQTEPTVLVIFITCAMAGLWLAYGIGQKKITAPDSLAPLFLCLLLWIGWQVLVTCFAILPVRSWYGPPQTGDGTGMWIAIALMMLLAHVLWQSEPCRRIILFTSAISLAIQCALHFYYPAVDGNPYMPDRWVPAQWPEYLPFIGGYLWVAGCAGGAIKNHKHFLLAVAAMALLLVDSSNFTAMGIFSLALLAMTAQRFLSLSPALHKYLQPNRSWRLAMLAACVAPFLLVIVSPVFPAAGSDENPTGALAAFSKINEGMGSRMIMNRVGMNAMWHEPQRWLIGNGWGTYTDDLFKYGLVDGIYSYKNGQRIPNWFLVEGTSHHSHNQPLEALLSLGLLGMLLWFALPMLALWTLPTVHFWLCAPMVVALTCLGHFWFQLPQCYPYQALYLATLLSICTQPQSLRVALKSNRLIAALVLALFIMGLSGYWHYRAMIHADRVHYALLNQSYKKFTEDWLAEDLRYGGDRWATSARFFSTDATNKAANGKLNDNILGWYAYLMHNAQKAAKDPAIDARASIVELRLQYYLFGGFDDPRSNPLRHEQAALFEDSIIRALHKAPLRDDYTAFFLINLPSFTSDDSQRQIKILERILAVAPNHRGAQWVLGKILLSISGKEERGRKLLQKAIAHHVEDVFPITGDELQAVRSQLKL